MVLAGCSLPSMSKNLKTGTIAPIFGRVIFGSVHAEI